MEDDYQNSNQIEEEEEEETTEQILEEIAEGDDIDDDDELLQQSLLPTKKHHDISIQSLDQIKEIISFNQYDLIDAKGGLDLVMVNGDQLIAHFLRDSFGRNESNESLYRLDWSKHGGQLLHLTYLVETFVKNLLDRDMRIDIVFFEDIRTSQCIKSSFLLNLAYEINQDLGISFQSLAYSFLVAKQAISSQLKKISETHYKSDVFTVTFLNDTWYKSSNWENLITKRKPSFIISTLAQNSHIDELFCTETVLVRQIIIAYDLCFYGNTVTGFCSAVRDNMTSSYKLREVELFLEKNFSEERSENMAKLTSQIGLTVEKQLTEIKSNIEHIISKELSNTPLTNKISLSNLTLSTIASIDSLSEQTTPNSLALSKIFILTNIIQSIIPLKDRAQHIEDASLDSSLISFQEKILTSLFHSLKQTNINDNLHDLLDFRLFLKVLTILLNTGVTQKLENNSSDDQILAELLPKEIQGLFKALASLLTTSKTTKDGAWWEKALKPLVSTLNSSETEEYKPRHPESLLREVLPFSQDVINGLVSGINITLPHKYEKKIVEQAPVEEVKPVEEEADDDLEDWEKEDWLKDEEKVEEVVVEEEQEILTTEEAKELTFEKCFPVREQEVNYSQKKDIDEQIPNDFSGPKTEWEKIKVQEAQKRLHRYSESIRALSEKKVIETARSSGIVVEEAKPVEQTKGGKPTKPNKKEEKQATPTGSAAPSTKVRLMMIESNTKKRDKEINELSGKLTEYQQKFNEYNNKADELKEHGGKIEQYESLTKLLLEGVFKDIRLVQNIQATEGGSSSNKKNASSGSESFTAALLLQEQRTTCENLWVQLSILRLQFMTRKLLLERQDLQTSLRRTQSSQKKKGVKFISFDEEPSDDKEEKKDDKKKGALKETNLNAVPQIDNLSGGADLDLSLYWEPFELTNRIYEIVTQLIGDAYISELTVATSASQEKDKKPAKAAKKPVKGDKKAEKVKPVTKIDLKDVIQTLVNFMCDLGFVNFAKRISEKFNQGEITFGALIKDNLMQQLEVETLPAETVTVKDAVNDKPESAEFQLLYNNAIIESASNIEIPPAEIPETISIESKGAKPKGHPKKEKPSRTRKDEKATEEESTTDEPSTPVSQNYVMPTAKTLGFTPDPWQEDMILSILQNKSILVSAPTSSGKTFIAFFAMEKVLRESDDNIIVYCCPTKALVNQAYAEVYSRFQKVYSNTSPYGVSSMLGMYTSDEKINVTTCQVLITVPQSLEHLMTSPENLEWKRRMKYIILDEIHCINESSSSGQVWEHVLSLLECPFIALSASIGNPKEFAEWLNENYNKEIVSHINYLNDQQQGVDLVVHDERPRPLEFYNYDASSDRFTEIHPMATLNPNSIDTVSFSLIQNFSPLQCLSLFKVASSIRSSFKEQGKTISANVEKFLADFNPDSYFNNFGLFKRQQFSTYGKTMKEELIKLSTETDNHEFLLEIIRNLLKDVSLSFENMERDYKTQIQQPISDNISESDAVSTSSDRVISRHKFGSDGWLKDNVIQLITRLAEQKLIPSIFFSFDRTMCDYLLKKISTHLRTARANSQLGNYFHLYSSSLEKVRSEKEIRYSLQSIEQFGTKIPLELREALEVGVAVHHHSCPSEYLTEVERLFRLRCLPVVISTSTLALGIHMPCKTVVMVGHSIYLTTTMFQQCAGRSGRRGYDVKGRVVLYGIPQVAANRLLAGVTPKIKGAMGLRANFLLKMLTILNKAKSDDTKYQIVSDDLGRLVNKKIFYLGQILENSELQNKLCFRFILDFLRRNSYISEDGTLGEFSLLSNSLFYYEPANFLFIHLLKTGAINTYLQKWKDILDESPIRPEEKVELLGEKLLILLNLLFETRKLSHWDLSPYKLENYYANDSLEIITSNKAALNANKNISSENVVSQLNDYNRIVLKEFATFAVTYCKNYQKETVDNVLPLSKISFPHEESYLEQVYQESSLCKSLNESKLKYFGTSSFVAISGNDDVFTSVSQLLNCRNHNVILDVSLLPYIDLVEKISQKASLSISSYAVEFLRNGQKRQVSTDCDFPSLSLCFNSLKNFDRVLGQALYNIHLFMNIKNGANNDLFLSTLTKLRTRFHDRVTGGKKTRKKLKMLKTINVEMDDLEMVNSKGKLKNSAKSTKKDAVTKETGALQE